MPATHSRLGANRVDQRDPYRLFLEYSPNTRTSDQIVQDVTTWLAERQVDLDVRVTGQTRRDGCAVSTTWHDTGTARNFRLQMDETNSGGRWISDLVVSESRDRGWIHFVVSSDSGAFVAVPRLASNLMDLLDARHGPVELSSTPKIVGSGSVDDLINLMCDPSRSLPLLVAATDRDPELPFDRYLKKYEYWTRQVRGLAGVLILDPLATELLSESLGASHEVPPWTIRTFMPEVDPASQSDALRHRILGTSRLAGSDKAVQYLLGDITRRYAASRLVPSEVVSVTRALDRVADKEQLSVRVAEAATATEVAAELIHDQVLTDSASAMQTALSSLDSSLELVRIHLQIDEISVESLTRVAQDARFGRELLAAETVALDQIRSALEETEGERDFWKALASEEQLDLAVAEETRGHLEDEIRFLRRELQRVSPATAWNLVEDTDKTRYPGDFGEILQLLDDGQVPRVVFTGDRDTTLGLDVLDDMGQLRRTAWECALALSDYITSKTEGFSGGVEEYIKTPPSGMRSVGPNKHARGETAVTMQRFGSERLFPVPVSIAEEGFAVMQAHFKLGRTGMASPRMYYLDAFHQDGHVYIGYMGPHLTNTLTN